MLKEDAMDKHTNRPVHESVPSTKGLLGRWRAARQVPQSTPDSAELELGYESALPWFTSTMSDSADFDFSEA